VTEGWIKLYRKFNDWEWHQEPNMVALFVHLLINANHEKKDWKGIPIERGQMVFGRKKASIQTGISERSIRTCIERLKSTNELTIKSTNKYSIITLCNYNKYQTSKLENDQQNDQQTGKQTTTNKNIRSKEINIYSVHFENFYNEYPRKIGKTQANKSWEKISPSEEVFNEIMAGLANYIKHEWKGKEMKYIPHAATWLNQERWKDEVTVKKEDSDYL